MAISYEPEPSSARDQGLKLVSIGALRGSGRSRRSSLRQKCNKFSEGRGIWRKRCLTAGIALPSRRAEVVPAQRRRRTRQVKEVNAGLNLLIRRCFGQGRCHARGLLNYEGIQLSEQLRKHPVVIHDRPELACPPTTSWSGGAGSAAHSQGAGTCAPSRRLTRGEREVRANPAKCRGAHRKGQPVRKSGSCSWRRSNGRPRPPLPPKRASPTAGRAWRGVVRTLDVRAQAALTHNPNLGLPLFTGMSSRRASI